MNRPRPQPPTDRELDRLLASRLERTSPDFELRWRALRATLAGQRTGLASWRRWFVWPGLAIASAAAVALLLVFRTPSVPPSANQAAVFQQLLALDAALQPALPLLDGESRDAVLHLPVSAHP